MDKQLLHEINCLLNNGNIFALKLIVENNLIPIEIILQETTKFYNDLYYDRNAKFMFLLSELLHDAITPELATTMLRKLLINMNYNPKEKELTSYMQQLFDLGGVLTIDDDIHGLPEEILFDIIQDKKLNKSLVYKMLYNISENVFNFALDYIQNNNLTNNIKIAKIISNIYTTKNFKSVPYVDSKYIPKRIPIIFDIIRDDNYCLDLLLCSYIFEYKNGMYDMLYLFPIDHVMSYDTSKFLITQYKCCEKNGNIKNIFCENYEKNKKYLCSAVMVDEADKYPYVYKYGTGLKNLISSYNQFVKN